MALKTRCELVHNVACCPNSHLQVTSLKATEKFHDLVPAQDKKFSPYSVGSSHHRGP
ncbi:hypothetical protein HYDPIDRAFT_110106 [Hydnomerulius pinastri MD-312]|nr:hypothetical protein HYDPIDRAFT_110106 [Hydnomerulius pinastri MD-312]